MSDSDLLSRYLSDGSHEAFRTLVERHVDLVYSVARRHVRDAAAAEDVAQAVFIELARSARTLKPGAPLVAWLHLVSRRTALNTLRGEFRRHAREAAAVTLETMNPSPPAWSEVEPLLDEAVESLHETDRSAILLRFFENKSLREVGAALGTSDDAAQKRVSRAVDELRTFFVRRGVTVTAGGLATTLSTHAAQTAPAGLSLAIANAAALSTAATSAVVVETSRVLAMTSLQKSLALAACAALGGFGLYQATLVARQSDEIASFVAGNQRLTAALTEQRTAHATIQAKRDDVERRIDVRMASAIPTAPEDAALEAQMQEWLAQVDRVKGFLGDHPEWNIPELKLLPANYWFESLTLERLETDEQFRRATARLRDAATSRAANRIMAALGAYVRAHHGVLPNATAELIPHFDPPIDPAILTRYDVLHPGQSAAAPRPQPGRLIAPRPADVEYDANYYIGLNGYGNNGVAMSENVREARQQFAKVNPGQPATAEQLRPYLKWPVSQAALEKYLQPRSP